MIARIISIDNRHKVLPDADLAPVHHLHSKFIRRRQHVEEVLVPSARHLVSDVGIFEAITHEMVDVQDGLHAHGEIAVRRWKPGCVGNFMSNATLWAQAAASGIDAFILEDDAILPPAHEEVVAQALMEFSQLPDTNAILYLQAESPSARGAIRQRAGTAVPGTQLLSLDKCDDLGGSAAYAVKPEAARQLLRVARERGFAATDCFLHHAYWDHHIKIMVPTRFSQMFMLNEVWEQWNHKHSPSH